MKNLLIYTGPHRQFNSEHEKLARIQIDNSFDLGWKKEDIILVTDFDFRYNGIKSLVLKDTVYYDFDLPASKSRVISYLLAHGLIEPKTLYWCHDFDAYELNAIRESELGLETHDMGLVHYFYKPEWQCSSFFFKDSARDIFELLDRTICQKPRVSRNNEKTLTWLIKHNKINDKRYKKLNITYGIGKRCLQTIYNEATKPLKVLHFLPSNHDALMPDTALNMFMYGKNSLKMPLMTDRLIKIFHSHGIK